MREIRKILLTREEHIRINEALTYDSLKKKRKFELSFIDTAVLLNGTTCKIKQYAAMNPPHGSLNSGSIVTVVMKTSLLSDVRQVENELLVFGNQEGAKVECVGNLGSIKHVKVLPNGTSIIVSVSELKL